MRSSILPCFLSVISFSKMSSSDAKCGGIWPVSRAFHSPLLAFIYPILHRNGGVLATKAPYSRSPSESSPRADAWAVPEFRHECRHGSLERPLHGEQHHLRSRGCNFSHLLTLGLWRKPAGLVAEHQVRKPRP